MISTKNNNVYIVNYHYVREIKNGKYPNLKGLEFEEFKKQINFFIRNFNILSNDDFVEILISKKIPKKKSILLTFDDGYKDHYEFVFPFLNKKNLSGIFYVPISSVKNHKVLDVNKIHFILEKEQNRDKIIKLIFSYTKRYLKKNFTEEKLRSENFKHRFDDKKTTLIKRLLQYFIPTTHRKKILDNVFSKILNINEKDFSKKLYMNNNELRELYDNNFTIGSHGYNHYWLGKIDKKSQYNEIKRSIEYFKNQKIFNNNFSVSYPHGSFNDHTLKICSKLNIKFGLSINAGSVNINNINSNFILPRYDTNDFR